MEISWNPVDSTTFENNIEKVQPYKKKAYSRRLLQNNYFKRMDNFFGRCWS